MAGRREDVETRFMYAPGLAAAAVALLVALSVCILLDRLYPYGLGQRQPIPFSHRVHVHVKGISCLMCHSGAPRFARAGIPPMSTCLLCHQRIIPEYPYIRLLHRRFEQGRPIVWERVNWVPEFVYFNHSMHLHYGIDCGTCHGNVALMDRVVPAREFRMGFCVQCHRERNATHDCLGCHR